MRNAYKLRNTDFMIYDKLKELIDLRKKHMPAFHEAGKAGKGQFLVSPNQINYLSMANLCLRYYC